MAGHRRAEATPSFGRLCPAMTRTAIDIVDQSSLNVVGVEFVADLSGALFWEEQSLLVVSDLHLEKGSSFAARGVLLPPYDTVATLGRLAAVVARHDPRMVIALGDSFHDRNAHDRLSAADRDAMIEAILDGVVDAIATDHAPHAVHEKEVEFENAPNGITGLETALGLSLSIASSASSHSCLPLPLASARNRCTSPYTASPATTRPVEGTCRALVPSVSVWPSSITRSCSPSSSITPSVSGSAVTRWPEI